MKRKAEEAGVVGSRVLLRWKSFDDEMAYRQNVGQDLWMEVVSNCS